MGAQDLAIRYVAYALMIAVVAAGLVGLMERDDDARATASSGAVDVD